MNAVDAAIRIARDLRPDLWERTEQMARIIAPEAFVEGWHVSPPELARSHALKLKVMQGNAMCRAQAILAFLGVNTDVDWHEILTRLAEDREDEASAREAAEHYERYGLKPFVPFVGTETQTNGGTL